ncbi:hypothetical protein RDWZM_006730 [Blomia tropicalis]|uniref:Hexosyltransferase n=1 Tax=Blomia tropicalis TaxID=40697 RepID=A0A9Q0M930_BLOTA|nr:hypothetical protein RDWZM_006730 [Blomia tropicalis]
MVINKTTKRTIHILIGIIIGFILTTKLRTINYETFKHDLFQQLCYGRLSNQATISNRLEDSFSDVENTLKSIRNQLINATNHSRRHLLLVGVMTAKQFIDSRALSIWKTWARDLDGHVVFFSSSGSRSLDKIPIVALPGVDDSYPPQKKSFLMFKFMNDFFGDRYHFFMRADDDVFVNVGKMKEFLHKLNSTNRIFIGQTGVGNKDEFGQLNLNLHDNFCMGGPGIIMSYTTLSNLASNVEHCLQNLYSTHEDVEIGRCVRKFARTSCTWSYDMQDLFYHNLTIQKSILSDVYPAKQLYKSITIHPIKDPVAMGKLYIYLKTIENQNIRFKISKTYRKIQHHMNRLTTFDLERLIPLFDFDNRTQFNQFISKVKQNGKLGLDLSLDSINQFTSNETWKFFAQKMYSELSANPKRHIDPSIVQSFNINIQRIMELVNCQSVRKGRILDYNSLVYGYVKFDNQIGVQYILDLTMIYRKFQGKRVTIPIRRHAHALQTFSETLIRYTHPNDIDRKMVNVVVSLLGRMEIFKRFVENFRQVFALDPHLSLSIMLFADNNQTKQFEFHKIISEDLIKHHPQLTVNVVEIGGAFSRGVAFQRSLQLFSDDALLFFLDVDMHFRADVFKRVRRNTIKDEQVYFPIVFSQYSNQLSETLSSTNGQLYIDELDGYWRQFGFGIVALYKSDLISVGGYDININGWGMEDVNLYDRFVVSNRTIFRTADPGLIHIYHDIHCDSTLSSIQYEMCLGTKLSSFDSTIEISRLIKTHNLL